MMTGWIGICLGVLVGYFGRAMIYKQYLQFPAHWWIGAVPLAFGLVLLVRRARRGNTNPLEELDSRRRRSIGYRAQDSTRAEHDASNLFPHEAISQEFAAESDTDTAFPGNPGDDHSSGILPHPEDGVGFEKESMEGQPDRLLTRGEMVGVPPDPSRAIHAQWDAEHRTPANRKSLAPAVAPYISGESKEGKNTLFSMEIMEFLRRLRMPRKSLTNLWCAFILNGILATMGVLCLLS